MVGLVLRKDPMTRTALRCRYGVGHPDDRADSRRLEGDKFRSRVHFSSERFLPCGSRSWSTPGHGLPQGAMSAKALL
jgi:hypothetical protein